MTTGKYEHPLRVEHDFTVVSICTCHGDIRLMPPKIGHQPIGQLIRVGVVCQECNGVRYDND